MKNDLKRSKLAASIINLYITAWDGTIRTSKDGVDAVDSAEMTDLIKNQLGEEKLENYRKSFINYKKGVILCVNTPKLLDKFFLQGQSIRVFTPPAEPTYKPIRFTEVLMPPDFIGRARNLSTKYAVGEGLSVRATYEMKRIGTKSTQVIVYKDTNAKGRSRLKTRGGEAVAVWS